MDVDSENDQIMQAIALSLGQNVSSLESEVSLEFTVIPYCALIVFITDLHTVYCSVIDWLVLEHGNCSILKPANMFLSEMWRR